ncbi:MAG: RNA polymerase sigma factor [Candidatus Competibacterales bacterium]
MTALAPVLTCDFNSQASMEDLDDVALLQRIAAGDQAAFAQFHHRHYRRLHRFLLRLTQRLDLVEEVVNDTMLTVWQTAANFQGRSRVSTWLLGIGYHKAIKQLKRRQRHDHAVPVDDDWPDEADSPEAAAMAEYRRSDVQQAIAQLPAIHRAVVELAYFNGYSYDEIAQLMDCPVNTVKTRMLNARAKLRKWVTAHDPRS